MLGRCWPYEAGGTWHSLGSLFRAVNVMLHFSDFFHAGIKLRGRSRLGGTFVGLWSSCPLKAELPLDLHWAALGVPQLSFEDL